MKEKSTKTGKKIAGLMLASVLVVGSLGTVAAFAANSNDAVPKNTVISAQAPASPSETADAIQGTIQYSKDIYARTDGSQNFAQENWYDPATNEFRSDYKEFSANNQLVKYQSSYYLNGGNDIITIERDVNTGNPVSGTDTKVNPQFKGSLKMKYEQNNFDSVKAYFTGSNWTSVGAEQTADGKTLDKVMSSYQSYISDTTQANMRLIEFLDQSTGLPVKAELYEDSTGQFKLFSSDTLEYKYVADDATLFKPAESVPMTVRSQTDGYGNSDKSAE